MTSSLPRPLRTARLRALATLTAHIGDLGVACSALDHVLETPRDDLRPDALVAAAWDRCEMAPPAPPVRDDPRDLLVLLSACAHPSLPEAARIALILSVGAGLSTDAISRAFATPEATMDRRLTWSQDRIRPCLRERIPEQATAGHLGRVLDVLMLVFDDGIVHPYAQVDLPWEAVETTRVVVDLFPREQEPRALLALLVLTRARRDARQDEDGSLKALSTQDRSLWRHDEIEEGLFLLRGSQRDGRTGPYQLRASIQAEHVTARDAADTDWNRLLALHDRLMALTPSPTVALGRACALAEVAGPQQALDTVERLGLDDHLYHATRAELLRRLGRAEEADHAWTAAVARVRGASEHARLTGRMER